MKPLRYDEWVESLFNQTTSHHGSHLLCEEFWHTNPDLALLVNWLLRHCGSDLERFSNDQIALGLKYLFNDLAVQSDTPLKSGEISRIHKLNILRSFQYLYVDCFEKRCAPVLLHADQCGGDSLNDFCYMLWDNSCLSYWDDHRDPEEFYRALVEMLRDVLLLNNPACVESALHGLGHLHSKVPEAVELVVGAYLDRFPSGDSLLLDYARQARIGDVL